MARTLLEEMGERLKSARINRKLTQMEVYRLTQIPTDTLLLYETAQTEPDLVTLSKLADTYRVSLDWLITGFEFHSGSRLFTAEKEVRRLQKIIDEQAHMLKTIQQVINGGANDSISAKCLGS
ncbi:helix-turn-helix domain-containing protein [Paenibacillus sp. HJL G12]|uniref:Helix-turn-helix domain-containing protein n=1 Tax=Paenibacillus dendrobii TaxID=2691084 RepID=A0A7X3LG56_9BACL|nr:helix-turn-helix transcriptional regulator [Paenibacillus dendrobii]MWV42143.1 helix-turn-helix domain-containing protein [Paenibacillus dendrobii]